MKTLTLSIFLIINILYFLLLTIGIAPAENKRMGSDFYNHKTDIDIYIED